jgi:enamine deaminase RidA (YjgF/YER057c/UK114 family)
MKLEIFNPQSMGKPLGLYRQVASVEQASRVVFIAGQLATDAADTIVGKHSFEQQMRQVFANVGLALKATGLGFGNVVQFTTYLVHSQDIERFMAVRKELFPGLFPDGVYPPNTLLVVDRLVREEFLIEVQTIAAG